ncbi:MAG: type II toxin-antitoxin system HicB family antitoxin [Micrococcales bacterium]|nr:type II toxin-antitoxin system HicB family antitoxin [Micrococcales bacterium]
MLAFAAAMIGVARQFVDRLCADADSAPQVLADRKRQGKFLVRVPPKIHRQLVINAAEQRVALNRRSLHRPAQLD